MYRPTTPFYLLYQTGLAPTNGTSVQLLRLLEGIEHLAIHLLWDVREAGAASVRQSLVLDDTYNQLQQNEAAAKWWSGNSIDKARLRQALQAFPSQPSRAWVFCGNERDAVRAAAILAALDNPPFLLHLMDIFHNRLSEAQTPQLLGVIGAANEVVCTSAAAAEEVRRHRSAETHVLPCCSNFSAEERCSWDGGTFRIAMTGALWDKSLWDDSPALDLFASAWPELKERIPRLEVHYAGGFAEHLPSSFANEVHTHGYLEPARCEQFLRNCHLAYLPVSLNDRFGPYSVPSRLADYLACGLPTITYTSPSTGIFSFTQAAPPGSCVNVSDICELITAVGAFASDRVRWERAAANAASYAKQALHADHIRSQLLEYLDRCTGAR